MYSYPIKSFTKGKVFIACLAAFLGCSHHSSAARYDKDSLLKAADNGKNTYLRTEALLELSEHYNSFYKDSALYYTKKALDMARMYKDIRGEANALYSYAAIYINEGKLIQARETYRQGLELCKKNNETDGLIEGLMHFSYFYQLVGKNDSMMYYSIRAMGLSQKTSNIEIQAGVADQVGNLYASEGNYDTALLYSQKSLDIWKRIGHKNLAGILSNIGNIYFSKGNYAQALNYYRQAYRNAVEVNDAQAFGYSLNNIGLVYYELDSIDKAIENYNLSLKYYNISLNKQGIANVEGNLGAAYLMEKNYKLALEYGKKTLEMYKEQNLTKGIESSYGIMAEAEGNLGDYINAWKDQKLAAMYEDSLNMQTLSRKAADFETKFEIERKDNENNLLRAQDAQQKTELKQKTQITLFIAIVTILCLVIAILALNSSRRRKKRLELMSVFNKEITEQKESLEESDELKTKLFSIVSHDFKSPLASLQIFLSMLESGDFTNEEVKDLSGKLMERMNVTFSFIENLLGWAQSQLKGYQPRLYKLNIHEIAASSFNLYFKQAEWKNISFANNIDPKEEIVADENMIKLVLRNLVSNALKYTDRGGRIEVTSKMNGKGIIISVADNGIGMDPETMQKIFTDARISTSGTANEPGTGLGLMLSREFLEKNGGTISVESEPGKGSVFSFTVPVIKD